MTKTHALFLPLLALCLAGCFGRFQNDRDAYWCVEDESLVAPAVAAAKEWHDRSANSTTGQVNFTFYRPANGFDCSDADARIRKTGDLPPDSTGSMGAYPGYSELRVGPMVEDPRELHALLLHEFGHFLVGGRHSDDERDIMFPNYVGAWHLTDADVAMLDDGAAGWEQ